MIFFIDTAETFANNYFGNARFNYNRNIISRLQDIRYIYVCVTRVSARDSIFEKQDWKHKPTGSVVFPSTVMDDDRCLPVKVEQKRANVYVRKR